MAFGRIEQISARNTGISAAYNYIIGTTKKQAGCAVQSIHGNE